MVGEKGLKTETSRSTFESRHFIEKDWKLCVTWASCHRTRKGYLQGLVLWEGPMKGYKPSEAYVWGSSSQLIKLPPLSGVLFHNTGSLFLTTYPWGQSSVLGHKPLVLANQTTAWYETWFSFPSLCDFVWILAKQMVSLTFQARKPHFLWIFTRLPSTDAFQISFAEHTSYFEP